MTQAMVDAGYDAFVQEWGGELHFCPFECTTAEELYTEVAPQIKEFRELMRRFRVNERHVVASLMGGGALRGDWPIEIVIVVSKHLSDKDKRHAAYESFGYRRIGRNFRYVFEPHAYPDVADQYEDLIDAVRSTLPVDLVNHVYLYSVLLPHMRRYGRRRS